MTKKKGIESDQDLRRTTVDDVRHILANPFYCLSSVDPVFTVDHPVMITEKEWIKCAILAIEEDGAKKFLETLLDNLKGNYVT